MQVERDLEVVIGSIISFIPETETVLINKLNKLLDNLLYIPPEVKNIGYGWSIFGTLLNKHIPNITEDWQIKIQDIVNNTSKNVVANDS
jgi:hypothetical protein